MSWIAAIVTGSMMYIMLDQYESSLDLKQFIVSAVTAPSSKSFDRPIPLKLNGSSLAYHFFSFRECPLVLMLECLISKILHTSINTYKYISIYA